MMLNFNSPRTEILTILSCLLTAMMRRFNPSLRGSQMALLFVLLLNGQLVAEENYEGERADEDWYQIEVVIFKYSQPEQKVLRYERIDTHLPEHTHYNYLYPHGEEPLTDNQFIPLPLEARDLADNVQRIRREPGYQVLDYLAWKQRLERDSAFLPLPIGAGEQYGEKYELEGTIRLRRSRFIHIDVDLLLAKYRGLPFDSLQRWLLQDEAIRWPADFLVYPLAVEHSALWQEGESLLPYQASRLTQSRRIKEGEIHYLDHPALGVIATVKEVEAPFLFGQYSEQNASAGTQ